jgi:hypothetical protein
MNDRMILQLLDAERETIADTDVTLEKTPYVVRAIGIGTEGSWNGIVYSHFSIAEAEEVINDEISYFVKIGRGFEWKVYSYDQPSDLLTRLRRHGFKIGEEEAIMVLDLQELPAKLLAPAPEGIIVRTVTDYPGISHFLVLEAAIWGRSTTTREFLLSSLSDQLQRNLAFVAYADHNPIGFGRVSASPQSCFASGVEAFSQTFAGAAFTVHSWQLGFNMRRNSIRFVFCELTRWQPAVRSWSDTDSSD